jgi:hypothetical protein
MLILVGRYLRLFYLYMKQRYSAWFLLVLLFTVIIEVVDVISVDNTYVVNPLLGVNRYMVLVLFLDLVIVLMMVITVFFMPTYFSRSEIEFVFTTGWDPGSFVMMKVAGDGVYILLLILALTIYYSLHLIMINPLLLIPLYIINTSLISFIMSGLLLYLHVLAMRFRAIIIAVFTVYLIVTTLLNINVNVLFSAIEPLPQYTIALSMVSLAMVMHLRRFAREISVNIYGLHQDHVVGSYRALFDNVGSRFYAVFITSMYGQQSSRRVPIPVRLNGLLVSVLLSTLFAVMYGILIVRNDHPELVSFLIYYVSFYVILMASLILGSTLTFERPWINFTSGVAHIDYIRLRMGSRLLITYLVTLPWILVNALLYYLFHEVVTIMIIVPLIAYPPLMAPLSWLLMILTNLPQTRDLMLDYRPIRFSVSGAFSGIVVTVLAGLLLTPIFVWQYLHVSIELTLIALLVELAISLLVYVLLLYSGVGRYVWDWFIEKLSVIGYS